MNGEASHYGFTTWKTAQADFARSGSQTVSAETDEGEVGQVEDFSHGDPLVLVRFSGRPPLTCTIGDDCELGAVVVA